MSQKLSAVVLAGCLCAVSAVHAQSLDKELTSLAAGLAKALVSQGAKNVAAVDFTDLQGTPTELGRLLSERLTVEIVLTGSVSMLDRANIKRILAEHKLSEEGLVDPANAKKLGQFAGVDAILIGNVTALDANIELMVKAISTESAIIIAAGRTTFPKSTEIQQLLSRGITASLGSSSVSGVAGARPKSGYEAASGIVTKDLGPLRVVLKALLPVQLNGGRTRAIKCSGSSPNRVGEFRRKITVGG